MQMASNEDLIYVDCDGGSNFNYCGPPGFRPCATIEYAWDTVADGPDDGAEDIVCFTGTCRPAQFSFPRGIPWRSRTLDQDQERIGNPQLGISERSGDACRLGSRQ